MPASERREYAGGAAATTLTAGVGAGDLTLSVASAAGWPTGATGPFFITINRGSASEERVKITSRSGTALTVAARGADGTSAAAHSAGASVEHTLAADDLALVNRHAADAAQGEQDHATLLNNARHDLTARHTIGTVVPAGTPGASAVGDTADQGAANSVARSDHRHAREGFAAPAASAVGDTVAAGSAATVARSDHRHAREAFGSPVSIAAANANGSATTVARSDHAHAIPTDGVTADHLAANSVGTSELIDGNVTAAKLAADALATNAPKGEVAYAQVTANQGSIVGSQVDLTGLSVTWTVPSGGAGRKYRITARVEFQSTNTDSTATLSLTDAANAGKQRANMPIPVANGDHNVVLVHRETLTAGSVTRKLRAIRTLGTGTIQMSATAGTPAFIQVEDVGPA